MPLLGSTPRHSMIRLLPSLARDGDIFRPLIQLKAAKFDQNQSLRAAETLSASNFSGAQIKHPHTHTNTRCFIDVCGHRRHLSSRALGARSRRARSCNISSRCFSKTTKETRRATISERAGPPLAARLSITALLIEQLNFTVIAASRPYCSAELHGALLTRCPSASLARRPMLETISAHSFWLGHLAQSARIVE